jgi:putative peptide maturation system protein
MRDGFEAATIDALRLLFRLVEDGESPARALARARRLSESHPGLKSELVWEIDPYEQVPHYDALLTAPGQGTVSVSFAPERAIPWPLRGAQRISERDLLRVNQEVMSFEEAMICVDFIWREKRILHRLIDVCLVKEARKVLSIEASDDELQEAMDDFRLAHGLLTYDQTERWLQENGLDQSQLESSLADEVAVRKLRDHVARGQEEDYFAEHRQDLTMATILRLELSDHAEALELADRLSSRSSPLEAMAGATGTLVEVRRRDLDPTIAESLFDQQATVTGPVEEGNRHVVLCVLDRREAELDASTLALVRNILFEQWLEERRQAASIAWLWGRSER